MGTSFSSSAITHEVIIGQHVSYRQSIMDSSRGSLRCTVWERKFVDQDEARSDKIGIVLKEEGRGDLGSAGGLD